MIEQVSDAAKKVTIKQALSAKSEKGIFSIEGIPAKRVRILAAAISKEQRGGGRFIKVTIDDGTGRMDIYDSSHLNEYGVGSVCDVTILLKMSKGNVIYGLVELYVPISSEDKDILRQIRHEEIRLQKELLDSVMKEEGGMP
jgi:hypothetical protein